MKCNPKFIIQPAGEKFQKESMNESSVDKMVLPDPDSLAEDEKSLGIDGSLKNPDKGLKANKASNAMQRVIRDLSIIPFRCFN